MWLAFASLMLAALPPLPAQTAAQLEPHYVPVAQVRYRGRKPVRLLGPLTVAAPDSCAIVKDMKFRDGTIEGTWPANPRRMLRPKCAASSGSAIAFEAGSMNASICARRRGTRTIRYAGTIPRSMLRVRTSTLHACARSRRRSTNRRWTSSPARGPSSKSKWTAARRGWMYMVRGSRA